MVIKIFFFLYKINLSFMNFYTKFNEFKEYKRIYLRDECSNKEIRTPLIPSDIKKLIKYYGFEIYVQYSNKRIYSNNDYEEAGAIITTQHWKDFENIIVIGLKSLDNLEYLNNSVHIYFSHSYLNQTGSEEILSSFAKSNSLLLDLEFFLNNNSRLVAFGFWAGYIGTILALKQYYNKINGLESISKLNYWKNIDEVLQYISNIKFNSNIKIGLIGPNGNCGMGAKKILNMLGLHYIPFGKNSNKNNLENLDIVINCIKLNPSYNEVWFDSSTVFYKPIVISDVSCDYTKPNNPLAIYDRSTTWEEPVIHYNNLVDIISIDNLPSLIPKESSDDFSNCLVRLLEDLKLDSYKFWESNMNIYMEKITKYI